MKKIMCAVLCVVTIGMALSACGAPAGGTGAGTGENATAGAGADGEITLNFIHWRNEDKEVYEKINKLFEEQNPGIKISMDVKSANQDEYYAVLKTKMSGEGDSVDVLAIHPGPWLEEFARAGKLVDLTDSAAAALYNQDLLNSGKVDGATYGLPQCYNSYIIFYNKDIFDKYSLEEPASWEEMANVAKVLKENGEDTISTGFAEGWVFDLQACPLFSSYNLDNPEIMLDLQEGRAKWADPNVKAVFEDLKKMGEQGFFINGAEGTNYEPSLALFAQGKAAMLNTGSWSIGSLKEQAPDMNMGFFLLPNSKNEYVMTSDVGQLLAIGAGSKHKDAAMKYIDFLSSEEIAQMYADETIQFSALDGVTSDIRELAMVSEMTAKYPQYSAASVACTDSKFLDIYYNACSRAFLGGDIDALMAEAQTATDTLLGE